MKKIVIAVICIVMMCSFGSCGGGTVVHDGEGSKTVSVNSIEELEEIIFKDVETTVEGLNTEYEKLVTEINTYDEYIENIGKIGAFYNKICETNKQICIRMREYSSNYTELVLKSDAANSEKYDSIGDLYDCIYEDACGDIYDAIYDDLLGNMYDSFYNGIIKDGYDYSSYDEWYEVFSNEYDRWSDCLSDVYDVWSDALSDIYDFWSDVSGEFFDGDMERVKEKTEKFNEEIEKLKAEK